MSALSQLWSEIQRNKYVTFLKLIDWSQLWTFAVITRKKCEFFGPWGFGLGNISKNLF